VDEQACCYLSHERLAIIDPTSGDQPLYNSNKSIVVAVSEFLPLHPPPPPPPSSPHNACSFNVVFISIDDLIIPDNACHDVDRSII